MFIVRKTRFRAVAWAIGMLLSFGTYVANAADRGVTNTLGMTFVRIPQGKFMMGSPATERDRQPSEEQHEVTISKDFYLQTTEVTLGQWHALMGKDFFGARDGTNDMPVVKVSWFDVQKFIKKLNRRQDGHYRLPTEAEWEYAARAGSTSAYSWGDEIDCSHAMYGNNALKSAECVTAVWAKGLAVGQAAPVGQYLPNAFGLYDMAGNVWEWVSDWWGPYEAHAPVNPTGPDSGEMRVKRGGSWFKFGHYGRSANRAAGHPSSRLRTTGFRLVRSEAVN